MARTYRYRTTAGTLATRSFAESLLEYFKETWEAGRLVERERIRTAPATGNWSDTEWSGGGVVRAANGNELSDDAFNTPPAGVASFQLRFIMPDNPDYMRGWASYTTLPIEDWEMVHEIIDSAIEEKGARGVGAVIFHQYY